MLKKDSFIKSMHMPASVRDPCRIQITPEHNSLKTRITPKLTIWFTNNTAHSYVTNFFVRCQTKQYWKGHNHSQNFVKVVVTQSGPSFFPGDPIILATTKIVPYMTCKIQNFEYFYQKLSRSLEKGRWSPGW